MTVLDSRGSEIALTAQGDGKYTFTMPSRKVTVQASFAPVPLPFEDVPPRRLVRVRRAVRLHPRHHGGDERHHFRPRQEFDQS